MLVRGGEANYASSNWTVLKQSMRKHGSEIHRRPENNNDVKKIYADEKQYNDLVERHQGKCLNVSGKYTRVLSSSRSKPVPNSNSTVQENSESLHSWFFEEGYTSVYKDSGFSSLCITSEEREHTALCKKNWPEDPFGAFSVPKLHLNTKLSIKRSKLHVPVECTFCQSKKPYISPAFKMEDVPPYSSSVAGSQGDLEFQDLSVHESINKDENGKPMDALDSKNSCSECKETKDEIPELIERPKMRDSPEHSEETSSALKEIPDKLESYITRYPYSSSISNWEKRKEETGPERRKIGSKGQNSCSNPSYQVMLGSHVLQLLCVKKVLKVASEQDMKKAKSTVTWFAEFQHMTSQFLYVRLL
ncbi:hypothetical protein HHK36_010561 [Tetracentron sinense]|uniref:Uncharacterized protein n=1 Tax=Tetracentron sinense TaxID=13715 RepID=A0A834ZAP0_TETSI|nr:hypothetical protein HHK36_010561 [Tetracentron sinense]